MQNFLTGQAVTVTVPFETPGLTVSAVSYKVVDQDGHELVPTTSIAVAPSATQVEIVVPAEANMLPELKSIAARSVIVYIEGTGAQAGRFTKRSNYSIVPEDRLPVPFASFQSLLSADMIASDMIGVDAWATATDTQKVAALMEARNRLVQLRYFWIPEDYQRRVSTHIELWEYWFNSMAASEWATMDEQFTQAIKRAQVIEAAALLTYDPNTDDNLRAAGVTSITIGESSRTFMRAQAIANKMPLSVRSMRILARFLAPKRLTRT